MMEAFKAARLWKVTDFKPTDVTVDSLKAFTFFGIGGSLLSSLKSELPTYLAAADGHIDPGGPDIRNHCQIETKDCPVSAIICISRSCCFFCFEEALHEQSAKFSSGMC